MEEQEESSSYCRNLILLLVLLETCRLIFERGWTFNVTILPQIVGRTVERSPLCINKAFPPHRAVSSPYATTLTVTVTGCQNVVLFDWLIFDAATASRQKVHSDFVKCPRKMCTYVILH